MISDLEIADLMVKLYDSSEPRSSAKFDVYESGEADGGVCWASKRIGDIDVVCLRGSVTLQDWLRDVFAFTLPFQNRGLGPVHPGFKIGMDDAWRDICLSTRGPWIVAGHSLGAGRAAILCGLMMLDGVPPLRRVAFGEPRPGFQQLAQLIAPVPAVSYCNGTAAHDHDRITDIPLEFGIEQYVHPCPLTYVDAAPGEPERSEMGIFARHHMPLYRKALEHGSN